MPLNPEARFFSNIIGPAIYARAYTRREIATHLNFVLAEHELPLIQADDVRLDDHMCCLFCDGLAICDGLNEAEDESEVSHIVLTEMKILG